MPKNKLAKLDGKYLRIIRQAIQELKDKDQIPTFIRIIQVLKDSPEIQYDYVTAENQIKAAVAAEHLFQVTLRNTQLDEVLLDPEMYKTGREFSISSSEDVQKAVLSSVQEICEEQSEGPCAEDVHRFIRLTYMIGIKDGELNDVVQDTLQKLVCGKRLVYARRRYKILKPPESDEEEHGVEDVVTKVKLAPDSKNPRGRPATSAINRVAGRFVKSSVEDSDEEIGVSQRFKNTTAAVARGRTSKSASDAPLTSSWKNTVSHEEPNVCRRCDNKRVAPDHFSRKHNGLLLKEARSFTMQMKKARWFYVASKNFKLRCENDGCGMKFTSSTALLSHMATLCEHRTGKDKMEADIESDGSEEHSGSSVDAFLPKVKWNWRVNKWAKECPYCQQMIATGQWNQHVDEHKKFQMDRYIKRNDDAAATGLLRNPRGKMWQKTIEIRDKPSKRVVCAVKRKRRNIFSEPDDDDGASSPESIKNYLSRQTCKPVYQERLEEEPIDFDNIITFDKRFSDDEDSEPESVKSKSKFSEFFSVDLRAKNSFVFGKSATYMSDGGSDSGVFSSIHIGVERSKHTTNVPSRSCRGETTPPRPVVGNHASDRLSDMSCSGGTQSCEERGSKSPLRRKTLPRCAKRKCRAVLNLDACDEDLSI